MSSIAYSLVFVNWKLTLPESSRQINLTGDSICHHHFLFFVITHAIQLIKMEKLYNSAWFGSNALHPIQAFSGLLVLTSTQIGGSTGGKIRGDYYYHILCTQQNQSRPLLVESSPLISKGKQKHHIFNLSIICSVLFLDNGFARFRICSAIVKQACSG
jgi:hypothetical protein